MKMRLTLFYDRFGLRRTKALSLWSGQPVTQSGLDIAVE
jgi:hypothetical protein